jgi:hypothetical protein
LAIVALLWTFQPPVAWGQMLLGSGGGMGGGGPGGSGGGRPPGEYSGRSLSLTARATRWKAKVTALRSMRWIALNALREPEAVEVPEQELPAMAAQAQAADPPPAAGTALSPEELAQVTTMLARYDLPLPAGLGAAAAVAAAAVAPPVLDAPSSRVAELMRQHGIAPGTIAVDPPLAMPVQAPPLHVSAFEPPPLNGSVPIAFLRNQDVPVVQGQLIAGWAYDARLQGQQAIPMRAVHARPLEWLPLADQLAAEAAMRLGRPRQGDWLYTQSGRGAIYVGPPLQPPPADAASPGGPVRERM